MLKLFTKDHKNLLLIFLISGLLFSVQLAQASALHDHTEHTEECFLWHFQLGDDSEAQRSDAPGIKTKPLQFNLLENNFVSALSTSPYFGRAPPAIPYF